MIITKKLNKQAYLPIWEKMKVFTKERKPDTQDEIWLLEHEPVYTQGQAGKPEHILNSQDIPIIATDRGGQVTYHGPGQLVGYILMDIKRKNMGIRTLVCKLERSIVSLLKSYEIDAQINPGAPGVFVGENKIASIGLRVKNGCTYHGIALNVSMDLKPFEGINPCGFKQLKMVQMKDFVPDITVDEVQDNFIKHVIEQFE